MEGFLTTGAVALVLGFLAYQYREKRALSVFWASLALSPVCILGLLLFPFVSMGSGANEALIGYLLISLVLGIPLSILLGLSLASLYLQPRRVWWGVLWGGILGIALGCFHFLSFLPRFGFGQPSASEVVLFALFEGFVVSLVLPWLLRGTHRWVGGVLAVSAAVAATYFLPNVAFRTHQLTQPLGTLARIGAKRALTSEGVDREQAEKVFALEGDSSMMKRLIGEIGSGNIEPGPDGNLAIVSQKPEADSEAVAAMRTALEAKLTGWSAGNSSGSQEYDIESLCNALARFRDVQSVPLFVRVYEQSGNYLNTKVAAASALAQIDSQESNRFCVETIHALHPNLDLDIAKAFRGSKSPQVVEAIADFDRRHAAFQAQLKIKQTPANQLKEQNDFPSIFSHAMDPNSQDHDQATAILIRAHRPEAIKAFEANIRFFCFKGKEYRGFSDPMFVRSLISRSTETAGEEPAQITRFLGDWSPPEARDFLGKALFRFSSRESARGLGRIGGEESAKLLLRRLEALGPNDASFAMDLVAGLGTARQPVAIPALKKLLHQPGERPALNSDGKMLYLSDAAAASLKKIGTPDALALLKGFTAKGDLQALDEYLSH